MAAVSPPKPWEKAGGTTSYMSGTTPTGSRGVPDSKASTSTSVPPALPDRPSTLSTVVNRTASNYTPYTQNRFGTTAAYGASPYGGIGSAYGGMNNYSSPYSRFGGMGGLGSNMYGSGYGGMGGGMYGMGGSMYGGMGMMGGPDPNDPNSLTNTFSQSTQATFQVLESVVGAFGGIAQMLESTYMATHSSFFAMVSVAEQFASLRTTLGSILGIFTLARYIRTLLAKITGRPPPADATSLTPAAFASFQGLTSAPSPGLLPNGQPTPSKKPFLIFLAAVVGLPYLMTRLIRSLAAQNAQNIHQQQQQGQGPYQPVGADGQQLILSPDGTPLPNQAPLDPSKLLFCRALYDYTPPATASYNDPPTSPPELSIKKGDLVAVLTKCDPVGQPSEWWRCRSRNGRIGYLPGPYLEEIKRAPVPTPPPPAQIDDGGRVNTLTSVLGQGVATTGQHSDDEGSGASRADSMKAEAKLMPAMKGATNNSHNKIGGW